MVHRDRDPLRQVTVLDAQWSNLPEDAMKDVRELWKDNELGNNNYFYRWNCNDEYYDDEGDACLMSEQYPALATYLSEHDVSECWIHFWW